MQDLGIRSMLEIIPGAGHVMPEIANEPMFERMSKLVAEIERRSGANLATRVRGVILATARPGRSED